MRLGPSLGMSGLAGQGAGAGKGAPPLTHLGGTQVLKSGKEKGNPAKSCVGRCSGEERAQAHH